MNRTWNFTDLEFVVLWAELRENRLPRPFMFTTDIRYASDYRRERDRIRERLQRTADPAVHEVLRDVARPDIAIAVRGMDGVEPTNPAASVRLLATRRADRGYLLTQLPGRTVDHAAGFTVTECDPLRLADVIADALPEQPAGRSGPFTVVPSQGPDAMDHGYGRSGLWDSAAAEHSGAASAERLLRIVPDRVGLVEIAQGITSFGPRGRTVRRLEWRDLPDDGRYVVSPGPPVTVTGADRRGLIAAINAETAVVVRAIRDEKSSIVNHSGPAGRQRRW
ncbi:ESX secretion-associated protein EspG [Nocardia sp. BMG111209]|uniref:ESX secretion-associated protein EspG n=1 Tax=Nocardia sp. BMG111209 TaxID=1160137 RepID=UPI00036D2F3E|nr:ESX secretion-associated protein EspG [Nocardia sp. BMG111209]